MNEQNQRLVVSCVHVQALEDLVDAVGEAKALQERNADADRNANVEVSVKVTTASSSSCHAQQDVL